MPVPLLRLSNIGKSFAGVQALQGVSFELAPGEVHALVGENGAGKSTLVQIVTGAQQPDTGTIEINGHVVGNLSPVRARHLGIACTYQHPALFPDLSVAENIALRVQQSAAYHRVNWKAQHRHAQELLERIGTDLAPDTPVRELSMPHKQLVEIACALGLGGHVAIMDEPTASLTQREQQLLLAVVRDLKRHGTGVIYISHRLEEIFALADRVTVLRDGRHVRTCPTGELTESSLIGLMVGRKLSPEAKEASYPGSVRVRPGLDHPDPVPLALRQVCCSASGVHDISLDLQAGEILGLAGLVGAGRTELARTLFGVTPADSGDIILSGRHSKIDSPQSAVALGISYVPEDRTQHGIILDLPVAQNITMAIHQKIFPRGWLELAAERQLADDYIRSLGVRPSEPDTLASSLSGGNQQKVCLARWLAAKPRVLILDEPTQGVDIGAKNEIHAIIRRLARQGLAVLLISSELPELLALSDRIGVMRTGRLVAMFPRKTDSHKIMAAAFGQSADIQ